jgi:hypothetical protein
MKKPPAKATIEVQGTEVTVLNTQDGNFISLTDMLKAKDGEFFISDWLRNRNTVEFLGIWESVHNPRFNSGEFATIKNQAGLNSYKLSVKDWVEKMGYSAPRRKVSARDHSRFLAKARTSRKGSSGA